MSSFLLQAGSERSKADEWEAVQRLCLCLIDSRAYTTRYDLQIPIHQYRRKSWRIACARRLCLSRLLLLLLSVAFRQQVQALCLGEETYRLTNVFSNHYVLKVMYNTVSRSTASRLALKATRRCSQRRNHTRNDSFQLHRCYVVTVMTCFQRLEFAQPCMLERERCNLIRQPFSPISRRSAGRNIKCISKLATSAT